ncbi:nucleotide-binding alpha-beta plait domain-containing protein [Artemisia annua]|uniref:Nucleotide-binding alpha-beta plait domain-containing protein n=1 Tax=Artemisia annua TaxID=35608 RepID=A0A2U1L8Y1_ARTAN|nr:nucleotide-binding alpha-beta plait domain-containing protein [Artemisia annua]
MNTGFHRKPIPVEIQRRITKLFVANLPDRCSGVDLAGVLREHGTIFDIYIAKKRDKGGRRFGFVSFLDVKDTDEMLKKLYNIKLGSFKLEINIARFVLEDGEIKDDNYHKLKVDKVHIPPSHKNGSSNIRFVKKGAFSFKEALTGQREEEDVQNKTVILEDQQSVFEDFHDRSLVIKLSSFEVLRNIRRILNEMGLGGGSFQYIGGFQILLSFRNSE